jgi:hypothetical protein
MNNKLIDECILHDFFKILRENGVNIGDLLPYITKDSENIYN